MAWVLVILLSVYRHMHKFLAGCHLHNTLYTQIILWVASVYQINKISIANPILENNFPTKQILFSIHMKICLIVWSGFFFWFTGNQLWLSLAM